MTQTPDTSLHDDRTIPAMALWLGMGGAIPFVGLSGIMLLQYSGLITDAGLPDRLFYHLLMTYAALIASFLGGIRWGLALVRPNSNSLLWVSVIPSLLAWAALALPRPYDNLVLVGLFLWLVMIDVQLVLRALAPRWFGTLRIALTAVVLTSLLISLLVSLNG
jgi:hypothetical protein